MHTIVYYRATPRAPKQPIGTFEVADSMHDLKVQACKVAALGKAAAEGRPAPEIFEEVMEHGLVADPAEVEKARARVTASVDAGNTRLGIGKKGEKV